MTFAKRITESAERRASEREERFAQRCTPSRALTQGNYGVSSPPSTPLPKSEPYRDPALLEMARGRPCLLMVPAVCNHRTDTTVAAHSNSQAHGKGMGRKADDCYVVDACNACHHWLDFGKAAAAQRDMAFQLGHARQILSWRLIAMDPNEPARFRRAAQRALDRIDGITAGATA